MRYPQRWYLIPIVIHSSPLLFNDTPPRFNVKMPASGAPDVKKMQIFFIYPKARKSIVREDIHRKKKDPI